MSKNIVLSNNDLKKLQKVELEILEEFDRICRKHKIKYSLTAGTLLGAIRHNGFIPWDDDIDVDMPRKDYNKFIKVQKKELNNKKFYLDCIETDNNCGMLYAKLKRKDSLFVELDSNRDESNQNIWIDIFPIDNICNNKLKQKYLCIKIYCLKIILMYKYNYIKTHRNKIILFIVKVLSLFFNKEKLKKKLQRYTNKYNNKDTNYVASFSSTYLGKQIFNKSTYTKYVEHTFENKNFYIIKDYDNYLKTVYGNYMELPPKEKRINHHTVKKLKFPK